ncbi:MAG TPA: hypothetical protein VHK27_10475 [Gammaproteobacteria bacterium]|nr:hypothetical protein [Gammaproteobacteria bacterium]
MAIEAGNIHPATTQVWQAAEQVRQAIYISRWQRHRVTEVYDTVGALSELLIRLPQLVKHLVDSLVNTQVESCYHDSGGNVSATLEAIVTRLANTKKTSTPSLLPALIYM